MFFATNRLFRKIHRSLQFVEEEVVERGLRAIFVRSGIDTDDTKRWRAALALNSTVDEYSATMYADNVRAAHEGLLENRYVFGSLTYGYGGEVVSGSLTRRGRPRRRLVIDADEAAVVRRIYDWYVDDYMPIKGIVYRLNKDSSTPRRKPTEVWTYKVVRKILSNTRYRGLWKYGEKESHWISSKDAVRQKLREKPLREVHVEKWRIVDDRIWYAAQKRLAERRGIGGRKPNNANERSNPKILNGFLWCPVHNRALHVQGTNGMHMRCPACLLLEASDRPLFTQLNRLLAVELTCNKLAELIRADKELVSKIVAACQAAALRQQQPDLRDFEKLQQQEKKLTVKIRSLMAQVCNTEAEQRDVEEVRRDLARQRQEIAVKIGMIQAAMQREIVVPTEEEVQALLNRLDDLLLAAARHEVSEGEGRVRHIIERLTGGRINLYQCGEAKAQRGWLQGRFHVPLLPVLVEQATDGTASTPDEGIEVVIDYVRPVPYDETAEQALDWYSNGRKNEEIANALGCCRAKVTKLLKYAYAKRGETPPDGRERHRILKQRGALKQSIQEGIADDVKRMMDDGALLTEISEQLGVGRDTITAAKKCWYRTHGLPAPDGRTRRKELVRKVTHPRHKPTSVVGDVEEPTNTLS
jgi:hypothetical protein